ncbi:MAG: hypothetical protein JSS83_05950 [Cyanobacteria bacterium SZAS LIN-3]|nr:hypothetical protein [Cyanobacteria bacterium SZAS LIN-3]
MLKARAGHNWRKRGHPDCKEMQGRCCQHPCISSSGTITFYGYRVFVVGTTPDAFDEAR